MIKMISVAAMGMGAVAMVGASFLMGPKPLPAIPTPIAVEPYEKTWKLPNGTPAEQYVLAQLQEHTESLIVMLLQRSWVTLNRKASLFLTYAREAEFLTSLVIVGVMVLFSGPQ